MRYDYEIRNLIRAYRNKTIDAEGLELLDEAGFFEDDSEMYPHDEHAGLDLPSGYAS